MQKWVQAAQWYSPLTQDKPGLQFSHWMPQSSQLAVPPPGWLALGLGEDGRGHVGRLPSGQELGEYVDEVLRLKRASDHLSKQWDVVVLDDVKTLC